MAYNPSVTYGDTSPYTGEALREEGARMIYLPYGKTQLAVDDAGAQVLRSRVDEISAAGDGAALVRAAMEHPIGSPRLCELAKGKRSCVIILSDHTRPVPSRDIVPNMLRELREGNPDIEITLLIATGFHRKTTQAELEAKLGAEVARTEKIVVHDATDDSQMVEMGVLPSGATLKINRIAAETELLLSEGFIEPHFFAGFSGGRKSVLPGVADRQSVLGNHCGEFIASEFARTGVLDGNPLHRDMVAAAKMAKLAFIVNVVIDEEKRTAAAFAGDPFEAHAAGVAFLRGYCEVEARPSDIVISTNGGAPLDQNIYQSVKGMTAAEAAAKDGAVIIMVAECADGTGGEDFYRSLRDCASPAALYAKAAATPQSETIPDQWESQILARILMKHTVIFVTRRELETTVREMKMDYAESVDEALARARKLKGAGASVAIIPDGVSVIVKRG